MSEKPKIITIEILKSWDPCKDVFDRFFKLLPNGGTLDECVDALISDDKDEWGKWLFETCKKHDDFKIQTLKGYRNSGDCNSGDRNSGDRNSGYRNSGNFNSGSWNSGDKNSSGRNSGRCNSGNWNSGCFNSGCRNSGYWNSGDWNSGDWNSGDWNSGCFNSTTPHEILIFNKLCKLSIWENTEKPHFIYFNTCEWIAENKMSDQEKIDNENFCTTGGFLKKIDYKEAWENAWKNSSEEDKWLLFKLPNFDEDIFKEISGIDVSEEHLKFKSYANNKGE